MINDLSKINILPDFGLASVDNSNLYTEIPAIQLRHVIGNILNQNLIEVKQKHDVINIFGLIINQNYFLLNCALTTSVER
jgi:predicted transcriptional regulator